MALSLINISSHKRLKITIPNIPYGKLSIRIDASLKVTSYGKQGINATVENKLSVSI